MPTDRVLLLCVAVAMAGCVAAGEPRMRTLAEFQAAIADGSAPIRDSRHRRQGEIERRGDDFVIRDKRQRAKYHLDRQDDGSFAIRDRNRRRLGTIGATDASGRRPVRDAQHRRKGTIEVGDHGSRFRDPQFRRRLETRLPLED